MKATPADQSLVAQGRAVPLRLRSALRHLRDLAPFAGATVVANGFTDDLFPADQAARLLQPGAARCIPSVRHAVTGTAATSAPRTTPADLAGAVLPVEAFFGHYLKGASHPSAAPRDRAHPDLPEKRPIRRTATPPPTWAALHPGEVGYSSAASQTSISTAGNPRLPGVDPITGSLSCATRHRRRSGRGVATYRLPTPTGAGYTLLGSPTVTADSGSPGSSPFIAARLWDVDPAANTETLVERGAYRLLPPPPMANSVPAASRRLAFRPRPHPRAGAPGAGLAVRPDVQRPVHHRRVRPPAAVAGARGARGLRHAGVR